VSNLLTLSGMTLSLGQFRLGPLDLSMQRGDYLVLLGPSGCGKTSLLKALAGLYPCKTGELFFEDCDAVKLSPQHRRVGYVSQGSDLFPHLSVARNIGFGLRYLGMTRSQRNSRIAEMAAHLQISALLDRYPESLSGGETRRVALARCLVLKPRLLLLDEPLSMLDHNARQRMLELLTSIHNQLGTATIHVTHDREEAWALNGRCAVMDSGQLLASGSVDELFRRPRNRLVAEFLGGENILQAGFLEKSNARGSGKTALAVVGAMELIIADHPGFESGWIQIRPETIQLCDQNQTPSSVPREAKENEFLAEILSCHDRGVYQQP